MHENSMLPLNHDRYYCRSHHSVAAIAVTVILSVAISAIRIAISFIDMTIKMNKTVLRGTQIGIGAGKSAGPSLPPRTVLACTR